MGKFKKFFWTTFLVSIIVFALLYWYIELPEVTLRGKILGSLMVGATIGIIRYVFSLAKKEKKEPEVKQEETIPIVEGREKIYKEGEH